MKIKTLYEKYDIMPKLAIHQLRVGGIIKLITDHWENREVAERSVLAGLIHDMGNIAKFDLQNPMYPTDNIQYWREKQQYYWKKYGREAHRATYAILREAKLERYIDYLEKEARLYKMQPRREDFLMAGKPAITVLYADLRVGPHGVISLQDRIQDLVERYGGPRAESKWGEKLEKYIQELTPVEVAEIKENDVEPLFDQLLAYEI